MARVTRFVGMDVHAETIAVAIAEGRKDVPAHSPRARERAHQAALRALAFKWIRVLHRCWTDRVHYDESRYLLALQRRQAPLLKVAASPQT
jgi:hypothetical protein